VIATSPEIFFVLPNFPFYLINFSTIFRAGNSAQQIGGLGAAIWTTGLKITVTIGIRNLWQSIIFYAESE
jgi:hypothetical protein